MSSNSAKTSPSLLSSETSTAEPTKVLLYKKDTELAKDLDIIKQL